MIIIFVFFVCTKCNFSPWKGCERFLNDRKLQRERPNRRLTPYARRFEDERLINCGSRCQRHTHWVDLEVSSSLSRGVHSQCEVRFIAKNCESEANSLRFASQKIEERSLRFRFAFWRSKFAEKRKFSQNPRIFFNKDSFERGSKLIIFLEIFLGY